MKTRSVKSMGSMHPILFLAGMYVVALLLSIFICSSLFYSCNASSTSISNEMSSPVEKPLPSASTAALRY